MGSRAAVESVRFVPKSSKAASVGASNVHGPGERRVASSPAVWRRGRRRVKRPSAARVVRRSPAGGCDGGEGEEDEAKSREELPPGVVADGCDGRRKAAVMVVVDVVRARTKRHATSRSGEGGRRVTTVMFTSQPPHPPLTLLLAVLL